MEKGCPLLRIAYLIKLPTSEKDNGIPVKEARCMQTYCAMWNEHLGVCGLISEGWLAGVNTTRAEMKK